VSTVIEVTDRVRIPDEELEWSYARSGGPGGQNVNKVSSKAILRWAMAASASVGEEVKARIRAAFPSRVTSDGSVVIASQEFRDQDRNREACATKLVEMIRRGLVSPKPRHPTRPTRGSKERRLAAKREQAERKGRRRVGDE
jgi:ribosome-associated protein